jgi:hypothetical protein
MLMRRILAAVAALALVLVLAGCAGEDSGEGTAAAAGRPPAAGEVRLIVSRDFGATLLTDVTATAGEGASVMRLLAENAEVETQYGGGFVGSIDGLASTYGSVTDSDAKDWFYWVDGVMADIGAADYDLRGGETVWWDYHAWARAMYVPAAVHAFPAPWAGGELPVTTNGDAAALATWASENELDLGAAQPLGDSAPAAGIVVATAAEAQQTPWLRSRIAGQDGGAELVELRDGGVVLRALDGAPGPVATGACLALPNPDDGARPLLLLLTGESGDLQALLDSVTPAAASARIGLAVVDGSVTALPWTAE